MTYKQVTGHSVCTHDSHWSGVVMYPFVYACWGKSLRTWRRSHSRLCWDAGKGITNIQAESEMPKRLDDYTPDGCIDGYHPMSKREATWMNRAGEDSSVTAHLAGFTHESPTVIDSPGCQAGNVQFWEGGADTFYKVPFVLSLQVSRHAFQSR